MTRWFRLWLFLTPATGFNTFHKLLRSTNIQASRSSNDPPLSSSNDPPLPPNDNDEGNGGDPPLPLDEQVKLYKQQNNYNTPTEMRGDPAIFGDTTEPPVNLLCSTPATATTTPLKWRREMIETNDYNHLRAFLTQRSIQTLMFYSTLVRDPHTAMWLEEFGGEEHHLFNKVSERSWQALCWHIPNLLNYPSFVAVPWDNRHEPPHLGRLHSGASLP